MKNRETLIQYLKMKVDEEDWHGVADAAMDLREVDAEQRGRKSPLKPDPDVPCQHPLALVKYDIINDSYDCLCGAKGVRPVTAKSSEGRM